jgi:hypothetical protein
MMANVRRPCELRLNPGVLVVVLHPLDNRLRQITTTRIAAEYALGVITALRKLCAHKVDIKVHSLVFPGSGVLV